MNSGKVTVQVLYNYTVDVTEQEADPTASNSMKPRLYSSYTNAAHEFTQLSFDLDSLYCRCKPTPQPAYLTTRIRSSIPARPTRLTNSLSSVFVWIRFNALQAPAVIERWRRDAGDELFATAEGLDTVYLKSHRLWSQGNSYISPLLTSGGCWHSLIPGLDFTVGRVSLISTKK